MKEIGPNHVIEGCSKVVDLMRVARLYLKDMKSDPKELTDGGMPKTLDADLRVSNIEAGLRKYGFIEEADTLRTERP